jgi:hypothetical protein
MKGNHMPIQNQSPLRFGMLKIDTQDHHGCNSVSIHGDVRPGHIYLNNSNETIFKSASVGRALDALETDMRTLRDEFNAQTLALDLKSGPGVGSVPDKRSFAKRSALFDQYNAKFTALIQPRLVALVTDLVQVLPLSKSAKQGVIQTVQKPSLVYHDYCDIPNYPVHTEFESKTL